jgi:predicted acetyltransferase
VTDHAYELRPARPGDFEAIADLVGRSFHEAWGPELTRSMRELHEPGRTVVVLADGAIVGSTGSYGRHLVVPGGLVAAAHVSTVAVDLVHRRRGLLTRMMTAQLRDLTARREPVAVLWASEGGIYQRYGYGLAATRMTLHFETARTRWTEPAAPAGVLHVADPPELLPELREVYDRVSPDRPGWSSRDDRWWRHTAGGAASAGSGAGGLRASVHRTAGTPTGYALWRVRPGWDHTGPRGTVVIRELVTETADAYRALWRSLLDISLTTTVELRYGAPDEPLFHLVDQPRLLGARLIDQLWLRLVDVPGALTARRYPAPVDLVLEVTDALAPANSGRWHLRGDLDSATCVRTTREPDLAGDVSAFGAAYLGGVPLASLAANGRVREVRPGALRTAGPAFGWSRPPSTMETF